ncbi:hypothetical protein VMCG_08935 [Cytospora schulzeri]|uniref:F-box domain-containing protein n=1 Tax=Cytospora schulzeri TaxID=448051 RepID=A0A423VNG9_9PEZI|nr:hypothetical protein VMCG_08935 [Valsa malicola]
MCLVSRRFLSVAQPLLHHGFLLGYGDSWRSNAFSWDGRLSAFLRTIVHRRDLAASVKRIYVHAQLLHHVKPDEARSAVDEVARVLDKSNVTEYTADFQAMLKEAGALGVLGLVLALVPNLDRLSLQVAGHTGGIPALKFQALALAIYEQKQLSSLKTLDICSPSEEMTLFDLDHHAGQILEVAGPSLETLNLHMCGAASLRIGEDSLHLRHIRVTQSCLGRECFKALLSACAPGLETVVYEASYPFVPPWRCVFVMPGDPDYVDDNAGDRLSTDQLLCCLVKFRATLKSLHFDLRSRPNASTRWDAGRTKPLTGANTLTSFEALDDLFISACSICSPDEPVIADAELLTRLLPPNVKTLKLAGKRLGEATNRLANALVHLAEIAAQGDSRFGALEHVQCDDSMAQVIDRMAVQELFAAAGADFGYDSWPMSEATVPKGASLEWVRQHEYGHILPGVGLPLPPESASDDDL